MDSTAVLYTRYEADFATWATAEGWKVTKRGWPDFICRRGGEVMAVEVKGGNDGLSREQHATISDLRVLGLPTYVWTPESGLRDMGGPVADSLFALREENAKLRALVADAYALSMRVAAVPAGSRERVTFADEEARGLVGVGRWCKLTHWRERHSDAESGMTVCMWMVKLHGTMPLSEIAQIIKQPEGLIAKLTPKAIQAKEEWLAGERAAAARDVHLFDTLR